LFSANLQNNNGQQTNTEEFLFGVFFRLQTRKPVSENRHWLA